MTKLYFNLNEYEDELNKYYKLIETSSEENTSNILKDLFLFILKSYEDGIIGPKKFAYDITGTMQFKVAMNEKTKELIELAGELELPNEHISGNPQQRMELLVNLIKNL